MQIQISWLLQKPTDLDLHCLQSQDISGFSRTRVKLNLNMTVFLVAVNVSKVANSEHHTIRPSLSVPGKYLG